MNRLTNNVEDLKILLYNKTSFCIDTADYVEVINNIPLRNNGVNNSHFLSKHYLNNQDGKYILKTIDEFGMINNKGKYLYCYIKDNNEGILLDKSFVIYNDSDLYIYQNKTNISYYNASLLEAIFLIERMKIIAKYENIFDESDFSSLYENIISLYNEETNDCSSKLNDKIDADNRKIKIFLNSHQHSYTIYNKSIQKQLDKKILSTNRFEFSNITKSIINDISLINKSIIELYNNYKKDINNDIPHDYNYIESLFLGAIDIIDTINNLSNLGNIYIAKKKIDDINHLLLIIRSQLMMDYKNAKKGIWYYPYLSINNKEDSSIEIIRKLDTLKQMGINIIYLYPFYKQKLVYLSSIYQSTCNNSIEDYISFFINEAHKRKIEVYAFTQPLYARIDSLINKPPNSDILYQRDFNNNVAFDVVKFYDVSNEVVEKLITSWYKELLTKYDFDGIEYDMIRYPYSNLYTFSDDTIVNINEINDTGYTKSMVTQFTKNKDESIENFKNKIASNKKYRQSFIKFKEKILLEFIKKINEQIKIIKPSIKISASVIDGYRLAKKAYLQDYKKWLKNGLIQDIEPMVYFDKYDDFIEHAKNYSNNTALGIFGRQNQINIMENLKEIQYCEEKSGFVLFSSYQYIDDEIFTTLLRNNHHHFSISDINSSREIDDALRKKLSDIIDYYLNFINDSKLQDLNSCLKDYDVDQLRIKVMQLSNKKIRKVLLETIKIRKGEVYGNYKSK